MSLQNTILPLPQFKQAQLFFPDHEPWPEGVYQVKGCPCPNPDCECKATPAYLLDTPDGAVEIFSGDWIVQTFDNARWFVRLMKE